MKQSRRILSFGQNARHGIPFDLQVDEVVPIEAMGLLIKAGMITESDSERYYRGELKIVFTPKEQITQENKQ